MFAHFLLRQDRLISYFAVRRLFRALDNPCTTPTIEHEERCEETEV